MAYYVCYEDDKMEYADAYLNEQYALGYAEEAKERGYSNVRVLDEKQFVEEGKTI